MKSLTQFNKIKQSLRIKTFLAIAFTLFLLFISYQLIATYFVQKGYSQLEIEDSQDDINRAVQGFQAEEDALNSKAGDWANWDDAYNFVKNKKLDPNFISINTGDTTFQQIGINLILFASNSGKIIFSKSYDLKANKEIPVSQWWQSNILPNSQFIQTNPDKNLSGILLVDDKPMLVSIRPILTSNGDGPITGTLIFGRYLDEVKINELAARQKYPIALAIFNDKNSSPDFLKARSNITVNTPIWSQPVNADIMYAYTSLNDIFGHPSIILQEKLDRKIYNFGLESTRIITIIFIIFCVIMIIVVMFILEKEILSRLLKLQAEIKRIGSLGHLSARVKNFGNDELGDLANNINESLEKLEIISKKDAYEVSQKESILDTIGEGVVVTDEKKQITYCNPAFLRLLEYPLGDLVGKTITQAIKAYDQNGKPLPDNFLDDETTRAANSPEDKVILEGKNKQVAVIINIAPIYVNNVYKGVVRVFYNYSMELEVQKQKDDFFSIASHELRTPLTVISGNTDNILEGYGKSKLSDIDLQQLKDIEASSDRLISMVNDFLNVSRIDQGRISLDIIPLNLCDMLYKIKQEMDNMFKSKGLEFNVECNSIIAMVMADEVKLREIIVNIIGNSLKFTKKGSINTMTYIDKNNLLVTEITDTGMGISHEKQHLLFNRFQQAMDRTLAREAGGTGLGLYISREFARLMGGDMWLVKSEPGSGTTFAFSLPLAKNNENTNKG